MMDIKINNSSFAFWIKNAVDKYSSWCSFRSLFIDILRWFLWNNILLCQHKLFTSVLYKIKQFPRTNISGDERKVLQWNLSPQNWQKRTSLCRLALALVVSNFIAKCFNTLRPGQNGHHFADDIFKCIFFNENVWTPIKISLKFVSKGPINNITALVQIMAWRRLGDKPLSEPIMVGLPMHISVTRPQWV